VAQRAGGIQAMRFHLIRIKDNKVLAQSDDRKYMKILAWTAHSAKIHKDEDTDASGEYHIRDTTKKVLKHEYWHGPKDLPYTCALCGNTRLSVDHHRE